MAGNGWKDEVPLGANPSKLPLGRSGSTVGVGERAFGVRTRSMGSRAVKPSVPLVSEQIERAIWCLIDVSQPHRPVFEKIFSRTNLATLEVEPDQIAPAQAYDQKISVPFGEGRAGIDLRPDKADIVLSAYLMMLLRDLATVGSIRVLLVTPRSAYLDSSRARIKPITSTATAPARQARFTLSDSHASWATLMSSERLTISGVSLQRGKLGWG